MRAWVAACSVLIATCALLLWRAFSAPEAVAPTPVNAAQAGSAAPGPGELAEAAIEPQTSATRAPVADATPPRAAPDETRAARTTRVSLRVLEPDGTPWAHGRLLLEVRSTDERSPRLLNENSWAPAGAAITVRGTIGSRDGRPLHTSQTDWTTDEEGRVELPGVPPGLEFEVRALDAAGGIGGVLEGAPLEEHEVREETLWLDRRAWPVEGRCVDPIGAPLQGRVTCSAGEATMKRQCDSEGRFAFPPLFAESVRISARSAGLVREVLDLTLPAPYLELRFEVARVLNVTLVDELGEPFLMHELRAYGAVHDPRVDTYPEVHGDVHEFDSMPWVPLTLAVEGCGERPTLAVDATTEHVRWELPRPGEARFAWAPTTPELGWRIRFALERLDGPAPGPVETRSIPRGQPLPAWRLFAGRYRLQVHTNSDDAPDELVPIGGPCTFEVRAGETTPVVVGG